MSLDFGRQLTLQQLQRRFHRLRQLQNRLHLPPVDHFESFGKRYCLPMLASQAKPCKHVPRSTLEYMGGFFDGDGCVSASQKLGSRHVWIKLAISQAESGSASLLLFRNVLGGSICRSSGTNGARNPVLRWEVCAENALKAAALLRSACSCKQPQLEIASCFPTRPQERAEAAATLKDLKQEAPPTAICPSWRYLAGFFDAEGSITLTPPAYLQLSMYQKFPPVLHAVQAFLAKHGVGCSVRVSPRGSVLTISRTEVCKGVLAELVFAGLRVKREAARLALQLSSNNFFEVRNDLRKMVGNQARYQRLTSAGLERASEIIRLRRLAGSQHSELDSQLLLLQEDHKLKSAQERLLLVRSDIRRLLSQGALLSACGVPRGA